LGAAEAIREDGEERSDVHPTSGEADDDLSVPRDIELEDDADVRSTRKRTSEGRGDEDDDEETRAGCESFLRPFVPVIRCRLIASSLAGSARRVRPRRIRLAHDLDVTVSAEHVSLSGEYCFSA
jgi:hypothetical protein